MSKKIVRTHNRLIAGVCGGIGRYFDIDPTIVRIIYTLLTVFTVFSGVIVYIILWIIIPDEQ